LKTKQSVACDKQKVRSIQLIGQALVIALAVVATTCSVATEAFEVTREVFLESGRAPQVKGMVQTKDGGYVIAGSDQHIPWATRVDASGKVQWRHLLPMPVWEPGVIGAQYQSAVALADDSTLLCGHEEASDEPNKPRLGMFTLIDKAGKTLSHRLLYPLGDKGLESNYFYQCVPWGDGFAVVGDSSRWIGERRESFLWLLALDTNGEVKWEKLIPNIIPSLYTQALVMPNQDLMVLVLGQIVAIDTNGSVKAQKNTGDPTDLFKLVNPIVPDANLRIFPASSVVLHSVWNLSGCWRG
jgi:hypothetical protein